MFRPAVRPGRDTADTADTADKVHGAGSFKGYGAASSA